MKKSDCRSAVNQHGATCQEQLPSELTPTPLVTEKADQSAFLTELQDFSQFLTRHSYALHDNAIQKGVLFFSSCSEAFRKNYSYFHLTKILHVFCHFGQCMLRKVATSKLEGGTPLLNKRLFCRFLKINPSENDALGITIVLKTNAETERLTLNQTQKAISRLLLGTVAVPNISYLYRDEQGLLFIYFEIEKKKGRGFSPADLKQLSTSLERELVDSIQSLFPPLFIVRNEEEIYRNIVQMSHELKATHDIPQVTISFQEQTADGFLHFSVVVVRLVTDQSPTLKNLSTRLPKTMKFVPEMISEIGVIEKTHTKQANLITVEVQSSLFSRKNSSIDLCEGRSYVAKGMELVIGEYRDYNGGLFLKQNAQLREIKDMLGASDKGLIGSLFYSFTPAVFQPFILPEAGKACTSLILEAKAMELPPQQNSVLVRQSSETFSLIVIKTPEEHLKNRIEKEISNFSFPLYQFGHVVHRIDSEYIIALLYQYPSDTTWFDSIEKLLQHSEQPESQEKRLLRICFQDGDPISLNPHIGLDLRCRAIQKALFEGLTRISPEGKAELAAAKKVDVSDSNKVYLFTLQPLQWSNGEELTAFQFEKTWKQAIQSTSCLRPDIFFIIKNARKAHFGQAGIDEIGVKALDKWTLRVSLEYPASYFLQILAHPLFLPLYEECGEPFVFSGPFTLHTWHRDQSLVLIKNPYYWDYNNVKLAGIEILIIRDSNLAFEKYQNNEIDWIGGPFSYLPPAITSKMQEDLKRVDISGLAWFYCNLGQPLLSSPKVRRALSYSLDRDKICKKIFHSPIPCHTVIPTGLSQLDSSDIEEVDVHALFEEGLEELKCNKNSLLPLRLCHSHIAGQKELACEVQAQWQQTFGIQIDRTESTWNSFSHQLNNRLFHLGACYRHPLYHDPMYFFNIFYEPTNIHNAFGWQSETFNHWINQARAHPDETIYLKKAEQELQLQMPIIPIHLISYYYLAREGVQGIHFCHSGDVDFRWIYFEES